uniref:Sperm-activating peptide TG-3 n=1 Tax=Tripneustes gratilla TaxID=7673 RepID=Q7M3T5_TRIGR
GFDLDGGGVG